LVDPQQLAADYGISVSWLAHQRVRGTGPKFAKLSGLVKYRRHAWDTFVESRTFVSTAAADRAA
jgi:hypothetical protein